MAKNIVKELQEFQSEKEALKKYKKTVQKAIKKLAEIAEIEQPKPATETAPNQSEFEKVKAERDEYKKELQIFKNLAGKYGCSVQELFDYISTQQQISYYQRQKAGRSVAKVSPSVE